MPTQRTYEVLDVILPSVLMVLIAIVTFALTVAGIVWKGTKCVKCGLDNSDKPIPLVFLEMVDLAFPDLEKDNTSYDVFDKTIALPAFVILTVIIVPVISSTLFITFWNVYAVEESGGGACVENFDCFPKIGSEYLQQEPVENCSSSSFLMMDSLQNNSSNSSTLPLEVDITFDCYRLVFRYAEAFGAAGGILAITALCSKLYFSLLVSISRTFDGSNSKEIFYRFFLYAIVWLVCAAIFIIFLGVNVGIPEVREIIFRTVTGTIQFVMYCITMFLIIITGVIVAVGIAYKDLS